MCIHSTIMKFVYVITLLAFILVFIADFIEINFRHLKKGKKDKSNCDYKI
jgi:cbb3-type cytochrome oxidase subunit 3